jgi:hypothetical protein
MDRSALDPVNNLGRLRPPGRAGLLGSTVREFQFIEQFAAEGGLGPLA